MKNILLSTRPKWCEKICHEIGKDENGKPIYEKRIEVRKTAPKETPFKAYIYCSYGNDRENYMLGKRGKVIGEFICDKVMILTPLGLRGFEMREEILKSICLTNDDLNAYGGLKTLYGWHIFDLKIYDKPKELSEFRKPCSQKQCGSYCCDMNLKGDGTLTCLNKNKRFIKYPPQSWFFVEDLGETNV